MKQSCNIKCITKCTSKISHDHRKFIFDTFWSLADLSKQRSFISRQIIPKYPTAKDSNWRSLKYYFDIESVHVEVCRTFLINTLDISKKIVRTVNTKMRNGLLDKDFRGKHNKCNMIDEAIKVSVKNHIELFPTIESDSFGKQQTYISGHLFKRVKNVPYVRKTLPGSRNGKMG